MDQVDLVVKDGEVWTPAGFVVADVAVKQGKIVALGRDPSFPAASKVIDARGKKVIPGLVDTHTHHRDPGFTHKEDLTTATQAAAAGVAVVRSSLCENPGSL
jgi:dihydroorotase-like cyclic amidohydrolase